MLSLGGVYMARETFCQIGLMPRLEAWTPTLIAVE